MTTETQSPPTKRFGASRVTLNKVPEVTIWFWVIKILCTTVGESLADWINSTLGFGLDGTALLFTGVLAVCLFLQFRTDRYVPVVYWLAVVVVSVTGTLYTDILTDEKNVALKVSSAIFSVALVVVFGVWWARERTLSIHSIVTFPREAFYWLTVLVTFALGTATGDWTIELTGWTPGRSVLLPATLIAIIAIGWRAGANPVLGFWLAYILTRPLGANLGDWFGLGKADGGLGVGTLGTSLIFLGLIGATVAYLTVTRTDVIEEYEEHHPHHHKTVEVPAPQRVLVRESAVVAVWLAVAVATGFLLNHASHHKGSATLGEGPAAVVTLAPGQKVVPLTAADLGGFTTITKDTLALVAAGKQGEATARIKDLETGWDDAQSDLQAKDPQRWTDLDGKIDDVLTALRASNPKAADETTALNALITALA